MVFGFLQVGRFVCNGKGNLRKVKTDGVFTMIKYQRDDEGIQFIRRRFVCGVHVKERKLKEDKEYRKTTELGLIMSLLILIIFFQTSKRYDIKKLVAKKPSILIDVVEEIPQTVQQDRTPAPLRPSVPIASEDESLPEDETIELTNFDFAETPPPPPPPPETHFDDSLPIFVPFDKPPSPVGGMAAIQRHVVYPEIARKASVEGLVILHLQIDEKGEIRRVRVMKSLGLDVMDKAAIDAVKAVKWNPAMQRDMPIMVWYAVPIRFDLTN